jgi:CHAD domain-containing protein
MSVDASGLADEPATRVVTPLVRRAWRRIARGVDALDDHPSDVALHSIRILAKHCRYAAEAVAPVVGRSATRFAVAIAEAQTVLGDHQDTVVAEAWLRHTAASQPRTGVAAGQLIARLLARRARLRAAWPKTWKSASARLRSWF